jgi:FlaA1/EpsC-like NDP-sugar epimerase
VLRLENFNPTTHGYGLWILAFAVTAVILLLFHWAGIYSRYWLYASSDEFVLMAGLVLQGVVLATAITLLVLQMLPIDVLFPRSIPFITLLLLLLFILLPRVTARMLRRYMQRQQQLDTAKNVVIMGAGSGGALILSELKENRQIGLTPVGFLDDDPLKQNMTIQGIPVLGNRYDIQRVVSTHDVSQVIIAMPSASGKDIREIVQLCEEAGVRTKTIPGLFDLIAGSVSVTQLRDVAIEDLLRRDSVKIDQSAVHELMQGKRVLITGGGGSIGSELVRQIFNSGPAEIAILGHGENSVFEIQNEIRSRAAKGLENTPLVSVVKG